MKKKNRLPLSPDCFLEALFSQWLAPVESAQMPRRTLGSGSHLRKYHLLCFTQYGGRRELTVGAGSQEARALCLLPELKLLWGSALLEEAVSESEP